MSPKTALHPDDLVTLPSPPPGSHYELSEGELIAVGNAGSLHEYIKSNLAEALFAYRASNRIGKVFVESMFALSADCARQPDVSFVLNHKFEGFTFGNKTLPFAPDLAVEVISPSESAQEAEVKVHQYLNAGTAEVWQVYPESRVVLVRTPTALREVREDQILQTPLLPGFEKPVREFFGA